MMITPYIIFHGECKEALKFYQEVFHCCVKIKQLYEDYVPEGLKDIPPDLAQWVLHAELDICGTGVWFADEAVDPINKGNHLRLTVTVPTREEAQEIYERFIEGARIVLPPTETFYSTFHAEIFDKYGIGWNIVAEEAPMQCEEEMI